jgi:hypothetical protein
VNNSLYSVPQGKTAIAIEASSIAAAASSALLRRVRGREIAHLDICARSTSADAVIVVEDVHFEASSMRTTFSRLRPAPGPTAPSTRAPTMTALRTRR